MYLGAAWLLLFCHWRLFWFAPTINQFPISVCPTNWKLQRTILLLETPATKSKKQNNFKGFSSSWIFTPPICQFVSRIFTRPKATLSICHLRCFGLLLQYHSTWERRMYKTHFFVTIWNCEFSQQQQQKNSTQTTPIKSLSMSGIDWLHPPVPPMRLLRTFDFHI